jgi:broad specificity phosphatase PhoE
MTTTVELIPHLDAGDRARWTGVQNARPLTGLGRRQAAALSDAIAAAGPVDALYSSPAVRCTQSLEPLAERFRLQITTLPDLIEKMFGEDRPTLAARAYTALHQIREAHPDARVAACSHGDLIPALAHHLTIDHGAPTAQQLTARGQWYTIRFHPNAIDIALNEIGPVSS